MARLARYGLSVCVVSLFMLRGVHADPSALITPMKERIIRIHTFKGILPEERQLSITCGVVIDKSGLVVMPATFDRVDSLEAILPDGRRVIGKCLGVDESFRIAYANIGPTSISPAVISTKRPVIGTPVYAAGYAHIEPGKAGFFAVSQGIVSADLVDRWAGTTPGYYLATDISAATVQNLLFDQNGELLSVAAVHSTGVDLSMPGTCYYPLMDVPERIREELRHGRVPLQGKLGIALDDDLVCQMVPEGLLRAGLRKGDQIVMWDGRSLRGTPDFVRLVRGTLPGSVVKIAVRRGAGEMHEIRVTVVER